MPTLVCDPPAPSEAVRYYTMAGLPNNPEAPISINPAFGVEYDISDLPAGAYSVKVSACNDWACSLPSPLDFTVPEKASIPVGLRILSS